MFDAKIGSEKIKVIDCRLIFPPGRESEDKIRSKLFLDAATFFLFFVLAFSESQFLESSISTIESLLNANGFDAGIVDGIVVKIFTWVVLDYQNRNGLNPTTTLTLETLTRMGYEPVFNTSGK